jgi:hypothetical protein
MGYPPMYRRAKWTDDEIGRLGRSLQFKLDAPPKPKKVRYLDEESGKYKFKEVEIKRIRCRECDGLFYQKRPKQIFCQDFCRIMNWQKLHRIRLKLDKITRIEKMWG